MAAAWYKREKTNRNRDLSAKSVSAPLAGDMLDDDFYSNLTYDQYDDSMYQDHDHHSCEQAYPYDATQHSEFYCNATWDETLCWPPAKPNSIARLPCPRFEAEVIETSKWAERICTASGLWTGKNNEPEQGKGFTNYTLCFKPHVKILLTKLFAESADDANLKFELAQKTRPVELVGLTLSLVSLLISLFVFTYFKKLHNNRVRIHKNQFLAMLLQVVIRLVLYTDDLVKGDFSGLASSVIKNRPSIDNTPIVCEAFYILLEYGRSAMFMWMFIEAMYLNNLISVACFQGNPNYTSYYLIGWGIPALMTSLWAVVMIFWDTSDNCWLGYSFTRIYWILEGPRVTVIAANLLFLLNIMRILITKLREANSSEAQQIRPLHRSVRNALFLLPLLGIANAVTIIPKPVERNALEFGLFAYATNLLVSFQGFVVACIYCFFNADIKRTFCYFWILKGTFQTKNNDPAIRDSKLRGPKLHYKARSRSLSGKHGTPYQLQYLHPSQLPSIHDRNYLGRKTQSTGPPILSPDLSS